MSYFKGSILNGERLAKKFSKLEKVGLAAQRKTVKEAVLLVHEIAVKSIQENGDGTPATRYDPYRKVNVSDPGDPPNTDTGRLARSIKFEFEGDGMIGRVGTNLKYGAYLEFGTKTMEARPWLEPAVKTASKAISWIARKNIEDSLKGDL